MYVIPADTVITEGTTSPAQVTALLRATLVGPLARLHRYDVQSERSDISVGDYNPTTGNTVEWPLLEGVPDLDYAKLYVNNGLVQYFEDLVDADDTIAPVAGYTNRIRAVATTFKANTFNGVSYPLSAVFGDVDCSVGDVVDIEDATGTNTLRTTIADFVGEPVAASIEALEASLGNCGEVTADLDIIQTSGIENFIILEDESSAYDGIIDGAVRETYIVTVTQGSTDGDLTTARLNIVSGSGLDDQASVTPAAIDNGFLVGTRGLQLKFDIKDESSDEYISSESSLEEGDYDLIVGQQWLVVVSQNFTPPTVEEGGTYTGTADTTYIVTVSKGGRFTDGDLPEISVYTSNGVDTASAIEVTGNGIATAVGSRGVTITFSSDEVRKGDVYLIDVVAAGQGAMQTIVLANRLSNALLLETDLTVRLYVKKDGTLIPERSNVPETYNYELATDEVEIASGITLSARSTYLPLVEGDLYLEYRQWLPVEELRVNTWTSSGDLADIPGQLDPDNPLKWAIYLATENAGTGSVMYIQVAEPDELTSWEDAFEMLEGVENCYGIVPLTFSEDVLAAAATHVSEQSDASVGKYRVLWRSASFDAETEVLTDYEEEDLLATISEQDNSNILVEFTNEGLDLEDTDIRAGDILKFNFGLDEWGDESYDFSTIASVEGPASLLLETGVEYELTEASKVEIWRNRTRDDMVLAWSELADTLDESVRLVWPGTIGDSSSQLFDGYFAAAALAGLRSSVAPNRSLTRVALNGITYNPLSYLYSRSQLDTLINSGVWVLEYDETYGVYTRRGVTCAGFGDLTTFEEVVITNVHSIHNYYLNAVQELYNVANVTEYTLENIRLRVSGAMSYLQQSFDQFLGPQLIAGAVTSVAIDPDASDRVIVETTETVPVPLNTAEIQSTIVI